MSLELLNSNLTTTSISTFTTGPYANTTANQNDFDPLPEWTQALWWVGFACICPTAIVLNILVCWIILADKTMRKKVTNYPLLNLAVADLLTSFFNTPYNFHFMLHNDWVWSELWCTVNQFLSNVFISGSVFTLTAISVDRYLVLAKAFAFPQSKGAMYTAGLVIWMVSLMISSPVLVHFDRYRVAPDSLKHRCLWDDEFGDRGHYYNIIFMVLTYFVPLTIMGYCYTIVCKKLWSPQVIGEHIDSQRRMHEDRKRMVKMLIVVVTVFGICWLPTHVYFMVEGYWPDLTKKTYVQCTYLFIYWLAMSNNMLNPLIYFIVLPKRHLMQIFRRYTVCWGSQGDRAAEIDLGRGSTAPESRQNNGLSVTGVTLITMADETRNDT